MKMTKFEKRFVNRRKKAEKNIKRVGDRLKKMDAENINSALEIGCGIGLVSAYLANQRGMTVYGTDFDPEEINMAKEINDEGPKLHFQVEDASNLSFADNQFNLVISQNVFHHIPDWPKTISEIRRVLQQGGYLLCSDIVFPNWLKNLFKPVTKNYGLYTLDDIRSEFEKVKFEVIQKQKMVHGPFLHYEMVLMRS